MENIYEILEENALLNTGEDSYCSYFDPKNNIFVILEAFDTESEDFYKRYEKENKTKVYSMPFRSACERGVMKIFYQLLTDDERALAESYPYRKGFFQYMRETGLIYRYYEARDVVTYRLLQNIEAQCGVKMDFSQLSVF